MICGPGFRCQNGQCVARTDCPAIMPPPLPTGCSYDSYTDINGCPKVAIVCPQQNGRCGSNSVYSTCASACPQTCNNVGMAFACNRMCVEGCVCNTGYIFRTDNQTLGCVLENDCPLRDGKLTLVVSGTPSWLASSKEIMTCHVLIEEEDSRF